jgi:hypothetical protein
MEFTWLPYWLRSLEPFDRKVKKIKCCGVSSKESDPYSLSGQAIDGYNVSNVLRRLSVIGPLVSESRKFSIQNSLNENASSSEEEHDTEIVKDYRRRRSSAFNFNQIPLQSLRTENFKTLNEIEAIN